MIGSSESGSSTYLCLISSRSKKKVKSIGPLAIGSEESCQQGSLDQKLSVLQRHVMTSSLQHSTKIRQGQQTAARKRRRITRNQPVSSWKKAGVPDSTSEESSFFDTRQTKIEKLMMNQLKLPYLQHTLSLENLFFQYHEERSSFRCYFIPHL